MGTFSESDIFDPVGKGVLRKVKLRVFLTLWPEYEKMIDNWKAHSNYWHESYLEAKAQIKKNEAPIKQLEKQLKDQKLEWQEKLRQCEKRILHLPGEFDYKKLMKDLADAAWSGGNRVRQKRYASVTDRSLQIVFIGYTYERAYEDFSADCAVRIEKRGVSHTVYEMVEKYIAPTYSIHAVEEGSIDDIPVVLEQHFSAGFVEIDT